MRVDFRLTPWARSRSMKSALKKNYLPTGQAMWRLKQDQKENHFGFGDTSYYWALKEPAIPVLERQLNNLIYGNRGRRSSSGIRKRTLFPLVYQVRDFS